tara:strand:- start:718 stop:1320 length:603 start_codon:yes stop_codon:yes gene_type:complete
MPKQPANWANIDAGDIISFRYKSLIEEDAQSKTTTLLVLNPKYPKKLKNGKTEYYVNGLKIESNNISVFTNREEVYQLLNRMGDVVFRDRKNEIYRVQFDKLFLGSFGASDRLYNELKKTAVGKKAVFRSYLYDTARKYAVFYEPIKIPKTRVEQVKQSTEVEEVSRTLGGRGDRDSVESVQGGNEKDWEGTILGDIFKK